MFEHNQNYVIFYVDTNKQYNLTIQTNDTEMIKVLDFLTHSVSSLKLVSFSNIFFPFQETKDSLKGHSNSTMPFFDSASGDSLGRKVPPPVPPKGMRNGFSEEDRSMQDMVNF